MGVMGVIGVALSRHLLAAAAARAGRSHPGSTAATSTSSN
jgi:hypothetical protein